MGAKKIRTVLLDKGAVRYVVNTFAEKGKARTSLYRVECDGQFERITLGRDTRTLAVQHMARVTAGRALEAHRLGAGDFDAVQVALASIAEANGELPCPRLDESALREVLAKVGPQDVQEVP